MMRMAISPAAAALYRALVERSPRGDLPPPEGRWEDHLLKLPEQSRSEVTSPETPGA